jgi:hypothetical protein
MRDKAIGYLKCQCLNTRSRVRKINNITVVKIFKKGDELLCTVEYQT